MKQIKSILIEKVKGIGEEKFDLNLAPNMPNFLVAPNGFGKSSFATGLNSLNRDRLKLKDENFHEQISSNDPKIEFEIVNEDNSISLLTATKDKNEIKKIFDIFVINNQLKPDANYRNIQGNHITSPSLEVADIYIFENIPDKVAFDYKVTTFRNTIGDNKRIWFDITGFLNNHILITKLAELRIIDKCKLKKEKSQIANFINTIKPLSGSIDSILSEINSTHINLIDSEYINSIIDVIEKHGKCSRGEALIILIQIEYLYNSDKELFYKIVEYYKYCIATKSAIGVFKSFKTKWKGIEPKEINIYKKKKKKRVISAKHFGIQFPRATDISNGERDVVSFVAMLLKARYQFGKKPFLLIIDEVFDYLDDANLLAVQFYINQFIEYYKGERIPFFPIILTHLNPHYFKNYFFSKQKVHYLNKWKGSVNRKIENIVISRNNTKTGEYADKVSSYFLHFNPNSVDLKTEMEGEFIAQKLGALNHNLHRSENFLSECFTSLENYSKGKKNYDPLAVCIAIRIKMEKFAYDKLSTNELKTEFVETKMTVNKLNFARDKDNVEIPEIFYFLGTLHNEILHIRKNHDNSSPIYLKLNNSTIRKMIKEVTK